MNFVIEILNVSSGQQPSKTGKMMDYLEVAFKKDGKVEGKKLFKAFAKDVTNVLQTASAGQSYTITAEKEGDYWQWKQASLGTSSATSAPSSYSSPSSSTSSAAAKSPVKGEWETREERAARQVMIVKQSSLANAIATIKTDKNSPDAAAVIALAQEYTDWVLAVPKRDPVAAIANMDDDIPM